MGFILFGGFILLLSYYVIKQNEKKAVTSRGLISELKILEENYKQYSNYLDKINDFNTLHHLKLGSIINEILKLKKETLDNLEDKPEDDRYKQKFLEEPSSEQSIIPIVESGNIETIKKEIRTIKQKIKIIKQDDTFKTISEIDDWDEYFENLKHQLEKEVQTLKNQSNKVLSDSSSSSNKEEKQKQKKYKKIATTQ